jgi:hypothetical protein
MVLLAKQLVRAEMNMTGKITRINCEKINIGFVTYVKLFLKYGLREVISNVLFYFGVVEFSVGGIRFMSGTKIKGDVTYQLALMNMTLK